MLDHDVVAIGRREKTMHHVTIVAVVLFPSLQRTETTHGRLEDLAIAEGFPLRAKLWVVLLDEMLEQLIIAELAPR